MNSTIKLMLRATAVVACVSAFATLTFSQQNTAASGQTGGSGQSGAARSSRTPTLRDREFDLRMMEKKLRELIGEEEPQFAIAQIREDFLRLQILNSDLAQAATHGGELDLKFVAKSASEI